jgi:hypothetical protein
VVKATGVPDSATFEAKSAVTEFSHRISRIPKKTAGLATPEENFSMKARLPIRMQIAVLAVAGIFPWFTAGAQGSVQSQLEAKYQLTKPTDDKSDIVTAGAVLVLQKDKLLMYPTSTQVPPVNTYSGGRLSEGAYGVHQKLQGFGSMIGHPPPQTVQGRQFVTGEKFWVTGIAVQPDGVLFTLFSDPYQDIRYYSQLKFIYPKGSNLSADQVLSLVAEVLTVQADDSAKSDDSGKQDQAAAGGDANQQPAAAADAPAAAPAAPAAPPATVEIGQTPDQVTAILGQPDKILNLGPKQIYVYKDLKVTFVKGKVTDAQ